MEAWPEVQEEMEQLLLLLIFTGTAGCHAPCKCFHIPGVLLTELLYLLLDNILIWNKRALVGDEQVFKLNCLNYDQNLMKL